MTSSVPSPLDILFVLAHPDDESFGHAGLMAWANANDVRVGLVCATRGEAGEISDPGLGTPKTLGAVREHELRRAMAIVGTEPVRLLPYRDSGMAGTEPNNDPRSLFQADREAVLADVVFQIRNLRPRIVITFGPDGVYGHPDHIRIGEITDEAVAVAASDAYAFLGASWQISRFFHVAVAREDLREASKRESGFFSGVPEEVIATMGVPRTEITHTFDVSAHIATKTNAIRSHATQIPAQNDEAEDSLAMRHWLARESLAEVALPWSNGTPPADVLDRINILQS